MEKYDNIVKSLEIRKLVAKKMYLKALPILESMDLERVKVVNELSIFAEVYIQTEKYEEAKELLLRIYDRMSSRRVVYQLIRLSVKMKNIEDAEYYYGEYVELAPRDYERYVLRYQIDRMKGESYPVLIDSLVRLKSYEYIEKWAYELAKLYHKAGMVEECIEECSDIILWFGEGIIVEKARMLKEHYVGPTEREKKVVNEESKDDVQSMLATRDLTNITKEVSAILDQQIQESVMLEPEFAVDEEVAAADEEVVKEGLEENIKEENIKEEMENTLEEELPVIDKASDMEDLEEEPFVSEKEVNEVAATVRDDVEVGEEPLSAEKNVEVEEEPPASEEEKMEEEPSIAEEEAKGKEEPPTAEEEEEVKEEPPIAEEEEKVEEEPPIAEEEEAEVESLTAQGQEEQEEVQSTESRFQEMQNDSNLQNIFAPFYNMKPLAEEIATTLMHKEQETILSHLVVTGPSVSGRTTVGKCFAKALYARGIYGTSKVAKIHASKLNKLELKEHYSKLQDGTIIIEEPIQMTEETASELLVMLKWLKGHIFVILEDTLENIKQFFKNYPMLQPYFSDTIEITTYGKEELYQMAERNILEKEYELEPGAEKRLQQLGEMIEKYVNEEERLFYLLEAMKHVFANVEDREMQELANNAGIIDYTKSKLNKIIEEDFEFQL